MIGNGPSWRVSLVAPEAARDLIQHALDDLLATLAVFEHGQPGQWLVEGFSARPPDEAEIRRRLALIAALRGIAEPVLQVEKLPPVDWLSRSFQGFPPLRIGRFFIHGSHYRGRVPYSTIALVVDAATAFGSGEHPSTEGCLRAVDRLSRRLRPRRILDLGCGTGILALAAARLWHRPVTAVDIDPEAVRVTRHNARRNHLSRWVAAATAGSPAAPPVLKNAPYDLVLANILARPLAAMSGALSARLAPGGTAVLSGLLARDEVIVLAACRLAGLSLAGRVVVGRWPTLILRKRSPKPPPERSPVTD